MKHKYLLPNRKQCEIDAPTVVFGVIALICKPLYMSGVGMHYLCCSNTNLLTQTDKYHDIEPD